MYENVDLSAYNRSMLDHNDNVNLMLINQAPIYCWSIFREAFDSALIEELRPAFACSVAFATMQQAPDDLYSLLGGATSGIEAPIGDRKIPCARKPLLPPRTQPRSWRPCLPLLASAPLSSPPHPSLALTLRLSVSRRPVCVAGADPRGLLCSGVQGARGGAVPRCSVHVVLVLGFRGLHIFAVLDRMVDLGQHGSYRVWVRRV